MWHMLYKIYTKRHKHIASVHEGKIFNCDICPSSFSQKGNLDNHVTTIHKRGFKNFTQKRLLVGVNEGGKPYKI